MASIGIYTSSVTGGKSFRTTILGPVVQALKLVHKDKISWEVFVDDDEIYIIVKKVVPQRGAKEGAIKGARKAY